MPDFAEAVKGIENAASVTNKQTEQQKMEQWQKSIFEKDSGYNNGQAQWAMTNTNAGDWQNMTLPTLWESASLPGFDGVVWFRKKFTVPSSSLGKDIKLTLGAIDDNDITWINGQKVGETVGYDRPRTYTIPANMLKEGDNEIVVRVFDGSGGGGIYGDAKEMAITFADGQQVSLAGPWLYKAGLNLKNIAPRPMEANNPNRPTVLYNAMIYPFIQYSIRGAIWYQGESNAGRAYQYRSLFPALIKDWRKNWGGGDLPFYFVQLANFMKASDGPEESAWAELREAQLKTLSLPKTGMAVAIDIGDPVDIHPKNKQEVGRRLALIALANTYNQKVSYSGPLYQSSKVEGNKITLSFTHTDGGLKTKGGSVLSGFAIAGADKKFHWANATISGNQVIVSSDNVTSPVAVRYSWANNPNGNLYNAADLPASPFRTDDWQGVTVNNK
jgi:sialate O-acetylesterase